MELQQPKWPSSLRAPRLLRRVHTARRWVLWRHGDAACTDSERRLRQAASGWPSSAANLAFEAPNETRAPGKWGPGCLDGTLLAPGRPGVPLSQVRKVRITISRSGNRDSQASLGCRRKQTPHPACCHAGAGDSEPAHIRISGTHWALTGTALVLTTPGDRALWHCVQSP